MRALFKWIIRKRFLVGIIAFIALNHLFDGGPFDMLVNVRAQAVVYTAVTGTITDPNGLPYSGAIVNIQLAPAPSGPARCGNNTLQANGQTTANALGFFQMAICPNASIAPGGSQWQFNVSINPGVSPPAGFGPQSCTATLVTIAGASQDVSAAISANCPALSRTVLGQASKFDTNAIYVSTSCGGAPNCFQVNANVLVTTNATYTSGSQAVTTLASDPAFVSSTDVGKIEFAAGNCPGTVTNCTYNVPQGTISAVNSAHSVQVSIAATANSSGAVNANNFAWGNDDGPALVNAFAALFPLSFASTALIPQPTKALFLPCGMMFTSVPPFITPGTAGDTQGSGVNGCGGAGGTVIIPLPRMNCNTLGGCLFADNTNNTDNNGTNLMGWHVRDLTFWGLGTNVKDAAATYTTNVGVFINLADEIDNVWVVGWVWNQAGVIGVDNLAGLSVNSGSNSGGIVGCQGSGELGVPSTWIGGQCGGQNGVSFQTASVAGQAVVTEGMYINQSFGSFGCNAGGGVWADHGSHCTNSLEVTNANAVFYGSPGTILDQFGGGNSALTITAGIAHLSGVRFVGVGGIINQAGGTIYDDCGNILAGTTGTFTAGGVIGTCSLSQSATNPAVASRNTTLGTTQLLPANRWPGPNITIELYAYDSAAGASCTGNTTVTWTISYTDPTGTAQTSTATETITTNGGSTGGDALKVLLPVSLNSGTVVNYSTTYSIGTGCVTGPSYAAQLKVI